MLDILLELVRRVNHLERIEPHVIACRIYSSGDFTHNSSGNNLAIEMPSERWDTAGMHSALTNPERITVPAAGWYYIWGNAVFAVNATGSRVLEIRINGSTAIARARDNAPSATYPSAVLVSSLYYLAADDYVSLYAYQNSGGNLAISAVANYSPEMALIRLP